MQPDHAQPRPLAFVRRNWWPVGDLRYAGTELRIQRLRDELEASMRSTWRGRLVWWLVQRWTSVRRTVRWPT